MNTMIYTHAVAVVVGAVTTWLVLRNNPLWIHPWQKLMSHKSDVKALLREKIDKL
jgi:hypothetical protein